MSGGRERANAPKMLVRECVRARMHAKYFIMGAISKHKIRNSHPIVAKRNNYLCCNIEV